MNDYYGKYHEHQSRNKASTKNPANPSRNNITIRNREMSQSLRTRSQSTSLASANIKALRLYRTICRLLPYIIKIHEIQHQTDHNQAKMYVANHFKKNANLTNLAEIDKLIDIGYQTLHEAEFHHIQTGYLYKYLMSPKFIYHDMGIDRFDDYRANKFGRKNKSSSSSFLKDFYKGNKSHEL